VGGEKVWIFSINDEKETEKRRRQLTSGLRSPTKAVQLPLHGHVLHKICKPHVFLYVQYI